MYPSFSKGRFANFAGERTHSAFLRCMLMFLQTRFTFNSASSLAQWQKPQESAQKSVPLQWVGHSTFLLDVGGLKIMTDPMLGDINFLFKRILKSHFDYDSVPVVDVVIISHNHLDHMDERSLLALLKKNPNLQVFVPQGDKAWFDKRGFAFVTECMWWQEYTPVLPAHVNQAISFVFLPAHHWSQRGIFDHNRSLWGSWMIQSVDQTIYFGGDSAYGKHYDAIAREFAQIDCALMPIGPCEPHGWMKYSHMNSEEACQAFLDLGARHFVPMHWGAFWFGVDHPLLPIERLQSWWQQNAQKVTPEQLHILAIGQGLAMPSVMPIELPVGIQKSL